MTENVKNAFAPSEQVQRTLSDYVEQVTTRYPQDVLSITLYGSQARGDAHPESDIDLFLVVQDNSSTLREEFHELAWQVQFKHDMVISDIIRSQEEAHQMQAQRFPYYQNIEKEGIVLWKKTASKASEDSCYQTDGHSSGPDRLAPTATLFLSNFLVNYL